MLPKFPSLKTVHDVKETASLSWTLHSRAEDAQQNCPSGLSASRIVRQRRASLTVEAALHCQFECPARPEPHTKIKAVTALLRESMADCQLSKVQDHHAKHHQQCMHLQCCPWLIFPALSKFY